jgi:transcriptional regulator with XRE-family HTH domain
MTNIKLLEEKIRQSGLKKAFIAEKIGVSPNTFSALLSNRAEFKARQIKDICILLDIKDNAEIRAIFFA